MLPAIYVALATFVSMFSSINITVSLISYRPQQLLLSASGVLDALAAALTSLEELAHTSTAFCECNSCCDPFVLEPYDGRIDYSLLSIGLVSDTTVNVTASAPASTFTSTATLTSTSTVTSMTTSIVTAMTVSAAPTVVETVFVSLPPVPIKPTSNTFAFMGIVLATVFAFVVSLSHGRFAGPLPTEATDVEAIDPQDPIKVLLTTLLDDPAVTELKQEYPSQLEFVGHTDDLSDPEAVYSRSFGVSAGVITVIYVPNDTPRPWATAIRVSDVTDIQIDRNKLEGIPVATVAPSSSANINTSHVNDGTLSSSSPVLINNRPTSAPTPRSKSYLPSPSPTPSPSSSPGRDRAGVTGIARPVTPVPSRQVAGALVDSSLDSPHSMPYTIALGVTESYVPGQAYESMSLDVTVEGIVRGEYEDVWTNIGVTPEGTSENARSPVASSATPDDSVRITEQLRGDASLLHSTLPIASSTSTMDVFDLPLNHDSSFNIASNLRGDRSLFNVSVPSMRLSDDSQADTLPRSSTIDSLAHMSNQLSPSQELLLAESPPSMLSFSSSSCSTPVTNAEPFHKQQGKERFGTGSFARRRTPSTPVNLPPPAPPSPLSTADHPLAYKGDWENEPGYTRKLRARVATARRLPLDDPLVTAEIATIHARFPPLISPSKPSTVQVTSKLFDSSIPGSSGSSLPSSPHLPPPSPSVVECAGPADSDSDVFVTRGSRPRTRAHHPFLHHAGSGRPPRRIPSS